MDRFSLIKLLLICSIFCLMNESRITDCPAQSLNDKPVVKQEILTAKTFFSADKFQAGKETMAMVQVEVKKGWHVYANPPIPDYIFPVKLVVSSKGKIESTKILYPKGENFIEPQTNEAYKVYEGKVEIIAQLKTPADLAGKEEELTVTVEYQACDSEKCLPPAKCSNVYKIKVAAVGEEVKQINEDYFNKKAAH